MAAEQLPLAWDAPFFQPEPVVTEGAPAALEALATGDASRAFETGKASWYGGRFHGRKTASGERFDMHAFTAAHKTLPFGTLLRVRVTATGREAVVRINDRGPFKPGRVIDLSRGAAKALGLLSSGVVEVVLLEAGLAP